MVSMFTRSCTARPRGTGTWPVQAELRQGAPGGQGDLGAHQIDAGDLFGDRVLHLQPGVGLDEHERSVGVGVVHEKFHGAEVVVAGVAGQGERGVDEAGALPAQGRAGRQLDQLLVAALQRALPLPQVADVAGPVAENLHLEMPGAVDELLHVQPGIAEGGRAPPIRRRGTRLSPRRPGAPRACPARRRRRPP
jgi:hypothetical protein